MKKLAGVWLILLTCACGSSSSTNSNSNSGSGTNANNTTALKVAVNGNLVQLPFTPQLQGSDVAYATIALADPQAAITNPQAAPSFLGTVAIDPNACTEQGCPFTIPNVDVSQLSIGMTMGVLDSRLSSTEPNTATLFPLFTGVAQVQVEAALSSGTLDNVVAFAMLNTGYTLLATSVGTDALLTNGVMLGMALDGNLQPLAGATLHDPNYTGQVWYPGLDGNLLLTSTGTTKEGPTSASGLFIVSPATPAVSLGYNWTLTSTTSGLGWTLASPLGTTPGYALVVAFIPN